MHLPKWPPDFNEWKPGNPFDREPPLPRWTFNPWLTTEQMTSLETEAGEWAAHRAAAMIPKAAGFETVRRSALAMIAPYMSQLPPLPVTRPRARKPRVPKPTFAEELVPVVGMLTPEQEAALVDTTLEVIVDDIQKRKRRPTTEEIQKYAMAAIDWAKTEGVKITEAKGAEIVDKALDRVEAELARRAPARRARA